MGQIKKKNIEAKHKRAIGIIKDMQFLLRVWGNKQWKVEWFIWIPSWDHVFYLLQKQYITSRKLTTDNLKDLKKTWSENYFKLDMDAQFISSTLNLGIYLLDIISKESNPQWSSFLCWSTKHIFVWYGINIYTPKLDIPVHVLAWHLASREFSLKKEGQLCSEQYSRYDKLSF